MMEPRSKWTDERLDDLNKKVDKGFARVDADLREVKKDVKDLRAEMNARFDAINGRFDSMNRGMWAGLIVIVAAIIGSNATLALAFS